MDGVAAEAEPLGDLAIGEAPRRRVELTVIGDYCVEPARPATLVLAYARARS